MKINDITYKYYEKSNNIVIKNLSFEIEQEKITLITGKSGSGKSTLAYILAGLYPQNCGLLVNGNITIAGENISNMQPNKRAKIVSMMFQNASMQFCMNTLYEELIFCLENINLNVLEIEKRIEQAVKITDTQKYLNRKFSTLSGGEKQKCSLACIVALNSKYVILDEPFANIDLHSTKKLIELIKTINKEQKTTFVVIDHMAINWLGFADKAYILKNPSEIVEIEINSPNIKPIKKAVPLDLEIVKIENLTITIEKKDVIKNVNLSVKKGSIVAIVGESGCGKTTLLKSLYGKNKFSGNITVSDVKVCKKNYKKLCNILGIVLQNPMNQFITQKVIDEIGFNTNEPVEKLKEIGLSKYQKYSPYMLSQGQQRRLAVLSVITAKQEVLLLDEPTYGQDLDATNIIMKLLLKKVNEENLTVIMSTHDLQLAFQYANNIYEIRKGEIVEITRENQSIL